jgi:predicted membrane chloride channel (bestrophin family)
MTVASRAERDPKTHRYTPQASKALDDIAGYIRLFNALSWASLAKKFEVLLTPKAMNRMMSRGIMTRAQYETLMSVPPSTAGPQEITLQWIYIRLMKGIEDGVFPETETMEGVLTESVLGLRKVTNGIRSRLNAKVPLAYAHFVQFLVDFFLLMAPFGLYPELGIWR